MSENANTILIISSDIYVVRLLKKLIQDHRKSLKIKSIGTFQEIDTIEKKPAFSIIVIDDIITGATGLETLNILRFQKEYAGHVLFLSSSEDINKQASIATANEIIKKPIDPKIFSSFLKEIIPETNIREEKEESPLEIHAVPLAQTPDSVSVTDQHHQDERSSKIPVKKILIPASIIVLLTISAFFIWRFDFQNILEIKKKKPGSEERWTEMSSNQDDYFFEDKQSVTRDEEISESVFLEPENEKASTDSIIEKKEIVQVQAEQKKYYYVIAGSFKEEKNADKLTKELKKQKYSSEKISMPQGTFLVSYSKHKDMKSAQKQKYKIREKVNPHAWVLHH
jgi:DNA-binding response OmpR family regulator